MDPTSVEHTNISICSADVFDDSHTATPFPVLSTVPDVLPPNPTINCEDTEMAGADLADHIMGDIQPTATEEATVNARPPTPPSPNASGATVLPGLDANTQGVGQPNGEEDSPLPTEGCDPKKRYRRTQKMVPGSAITPRYEVNPPHLIYDTNWTRNICAVDWCALHPGGTTGAFNFYFDHLPADQIKVCPSCFTPAR